MRKMFLFLFGISILIFSMQNIYAETITVPGFIKTIEKETEAGNSEYSSGSNMNYTIGRNICSACPYDKTFRSEITFNVSSYVSTSSTIVSAKIVYKTTGYPLGHENDGINFSLLKMEYYDNQLLFDKIGASNTVISGTPFYMNTGSSLKSGEASSNELLGAIITYSRQALILGAYAANESESGAPLKFSCWLEIEYTNSTPSYVRLAARNNFDVDAYNGGQINVDASVQEAPYKFYKLSGGNVVLNAVSPQTDISGYQRLWAGSVSVNKSEWKKYNKDGEEVDISNNNNAEYVSGALNSVDDGAVFEANLRKECNVTVGRNNQLGGIVKIIKNGQEYTASTSGLTKTTVEKNPITLKAEYETANYINYSFQGWKNNATNEIESTNPEYTINPEEHRSYTAIFQGTANTSMMNIQSNCSQAGQRPVLTWTDNPNDAVSYKIYQQMVPANNTSGNYTPSLIASVAKGTQYYQHPTFEINNNPGMDHLYLEVKAYYSTENTLITAGWAHYYFDGVFPDEPGDPASKKNSGIQKDQTITKYAVANYPNPFNPTTVINYQVPEAGHVTLKVYDVMGKEIATLVDGARTKGSYNVNFSMDEYHLASGIYFCRMQAGKNVITTKMILSK